MSELATVHPKKNRMLSKIYAKFMYFFLLVQALPALDHMDLNSDGSFQTGCDHKIISITSEFPLGQRETKQDWKKTMPSQLMPQLLLQDKHLYKQLLYY